MLHRIIAGGYYVANQVCRCNAAWKMIVDEGKCIRKEFDQNEKDDGEVNQISTWTYFTRKRLSIKLSFECSRAEQPLNCLICVVDR